MEKRGKEIALFHFLMYHHHGCFFPVVFAFVLLFKFASHHFSPSLNGGFYQVEGFTNCSCRAILYPKKSHIWILVWKKGTNDQRITFKQRFAVGLACDCIVISCSASCTKKHRFVVSVSVSVSVTILSHCGILVFIHHHHMPPLFSSSSPTSSHRVCIESFISFTSFINPIIPRHGWLISLLQTMME